MAAFAAVLSTLIFLAAPPSGERAQITYPIHSNDIANPERGFHEQTYAYVGVQGPSTPYTRLSQNLNVSDMGGIAARKITVIQRLISLENYAGVDVLPEAFLTNVKNDLADAKALNIKLNLRFAYTFDGDGTYADPPIARIEGHIAQLGTVLATNNNADVVTHLDAGMLGRYGEWAFTPTQEMKTRVVNQWLAVLPPTLTVAVRTPDQKQAIFGVPALTSGFDGTDAARVGHHDDCYLASLTDYGTYPFAFADREAQKNYLRDDNRFVPMSGETCGYFDPAAAGGECGAGEDCLTRTGCATALAESARLRWSLLNTRWFNGLVLPPNGQWHVGANACYPEMKRRLGYRFELVGADLPTTAACALNGSVTVRNTGFASPFGPRGLQLVFEQPVAGGTVTTLDLLRPNSPTRDPRRWLPDDGDIVVRLGDLPAALPPGSYRLHLALPDGHASLKSLPAYAIQTANTGLWNPTRGWNSLNHTVAVAACDRLFADDFE